MAARVCSVCLAKNQTPLELAVTSVRQGSSVRTVLRVLPATGEWSLSQTGVPATGARLGNSAEMVLRVSIALVDSSQTSTARFVLPVSTRSVGQRHLSFARAAQPDSKWQPTQCAKFVQTEAPALMVWAANAVTQAQLQMLAAFSAYHARQGRTRQTASDA